MSQGTREDARPVVAKGLTALALGTTITLLIASAPGLAQGDSSAPPPQGLRLVPHAPTVEPGATVTLTAEGLSASGTPVPLEPSSCRWQTQALAGGLTPEGCQATYTAPETVGHDTVRLRVDTSDRRLTADTRIQISQPAPEGAVDLPCEGVIAYGPDASGLPGGFACGEDLVLLPQAGSPGAIETARTIHLATLPEDTPAPPSEVPLERVLDITLTDPDGAPLHEMPARLVFTVDEAWQTEHCPEATCAPTLFHLGEDGWETLETNGTGAEASARTYVAHTPGFSLFAVGGLPVEEPAGGPFGGLDVMLLAGAAVVASGGVGAWAIARARTSQAPSGPQTRKMQALRDLQGGEMARFVDSVTHDIANPLTPISMHLQRLISAEGEDLSEDQLEALEVVSRNVEHIDRLVADLREAARLESGELSLDRTVLDLNDLVADAVGTFEAQAEDRGIRLELAERATSLPAYADPDRLRQVLYNLISNALSATRTGGEIRVRVARRGEQAHVIVEDTGCGFDPEMSERLFEPFSQLPDGEQGSEGSGLGLFISRGLVERHGGRLWAESDGPGQGARFTAAVPLWGR